MVLINFLQNLFLQKYIQTKITRFFINHTIFFFCNDLQLRSSIIQNHFVGALTFFPVIIYLFEIIDSNFNEPEYGLDTPIFKNYLNKDETQNLGALSNLFALFSF